MCVYLPAYLYLYVSVTLYVYVFMYHMCTGAHGSQKKSYFPCSWHKDGRESPNIDSGS